MVFSCRFCNRNFASNFLLRDHEMIHTGQRAECIEDGCEKTYSNFANLRRHVRQVHEPERMAQRRREEREEERRQQREEERRQQREEERRQQREKERANAEEAREGERRNVEQARVEERRDVEQANDEDDLMKDLIEFLEREGFY